MGDMNINPSVSKSLTGDLLKPAQGKQKTQIARNIQTPETEQPLRKLGDFLKTSLEELHKITFGETIAPAFVHTANTVAFAHPESAKAAADASEFLKIHEK